MLQTTTPHRSRPLTPHRLSALRAGFAGELVTVEDGPRYDDLRSVFNGMFDRRPTLIARATCEADVAAAIGFARAEGLLLAVRAGGHSVAGYSAVDDGLLLDLRPMNAINVDPVGRSVRVGPGVVWGGLDAATQAHGLATTGGRMTTTGVSGFVLGSGSGWLERLHGLACDNLLSARVVTADGRVLRASGTENAELFWGLRGGGGNFGVVTELELRLHPVGPTVYGGILMYPRERAGEVVRHFRDFMAAAPREVAGGAILMTAPLAPFVPEELQGRPAVSVFAAFFGEPRRGPAALAPLRRPEAPVDTIGPVPYVGFQALTDPGNPPGRRNYWHSELLPDLPDAAVDALVARADAATSPASVVVIGPLGGAVADVPDDALPIGGRSARWLYHCYGIWTEPDDEAHVTWVRETRDALHPFTMSGMALNFVSEVDVTRVRGAFGPDNYRRLQALKDRYDPDNVFRLNQNVPPSADGPRPVVSGSSPGSVS